MKDFSELFLELDQTNKTNRRVEALSRYFQTAHDKDKIWTIAILSHRRPKRMVNTTQLREYAAEYASIPLWLFEESYHIVGDLAESIALVLPEGNAISTNKGLSEWIEGMIGIKNEDESAKKEFIKNAWDAMNYAERFVFNKLITGGFRLGVSQKLMTRALSKATAIPEDNLAHRLMGHWSPQTTSYEQLLFSKDPMEDASKPYPFYLAYAVEEEPESLGSISDFQVEWKWDGIRAQLISRKGEVFLWSRGEELISQQFPEISLSTLPLPDGCVLDGELLVYKDKEILDFNELQVRLGRKKVSPKMLQTHPVALIAYDILELGHEDIRHKPLSERRTLLEEVVQLVNRPDRLMSSPIVPASNWDDLKQVRLESRTKKAEGLMLKRKTAPYQSGRKKGDWWKWKIDPMSIDAVMIYAQRGHGRRANLYTDYTFAVWDDGKLQPFAKAYSGLTDKEFNEVTAFVRKNTLERFGPVRAVKPELVFEIAFEGIRPSGRHKSGIALRFPRIVRWRKDKPASEANSLDDLKQLLS